MGSHPGALIDLGTIVMVTRVRPPRANLHNPPCRVKVFFSRTTQLYIYEGRSYIYTTRHFIISLVQQNTVTTCFSFKGTTETLTTVLLRFRAGSPPRFGFGRATKYLLGFVQALLATVSGKQYGIPVPASAYRAGQL